MRFFENHRLPKPFVFGLLMAASFVTAMLPPETLAYMRGLAQPLGLPQWLAQTASHQTQRAAMTLLSRRVPSEQFERLAAERDALQTEIATLRYWNGQLQSTVAELANVRKMGFPAHGTLIPARVLGMDAAPGRDSMSVGKGDMQKVEKNDWVISSLTVGAGTDQGVEPLTHVLGRQYLIGWVEQVAPLTSRVILLSDKLAGKSRPRKVLISPNDLSSRPAEDETKVFILEPFGGGRMIIRDIPRLLVETGQVRAGDLVTSVPDDTRLPIAVVIGPIEDLRPNRDNPVCFNAVVRHMVDPASLSEVLIVDLSQPAASPPGPP
jgi:cell shape-determining protein MreC